MNKNYPIKFIATTVKNNDKVGLILTQKTYSKNEWLISYRLLTGSICLLPSEKIGHCLIRRNFRAYECTMKDCFEMSSSCFTAGYPHSLREFPMMNIGLPPPHMNWHYPPMYQVGVNLQLYTKRLHYINIFVITEICQFWHEDIYSYKI